MKCPNCNIEIETEMMKIPELKIKITKVLYHDKSYNNIKKLMKKNQRLLNINEVIFIINNKKISDWLEIYNTRNNFFFEQPIKFNKDRDLVAGFDADFDGASLYCYRYPSGTRSSLGVIFAEDLTKEKER